MAATTNAHQLPSEHHDQQVAALLVANSNNRFTIFGIKREEAADSHDYTRDDGGTRGSWTAIMPARDRAALEKQHLTE